MGEVNYHFVDRFTLVHFMIGVGYGFLNLNFVVVVLLAVVWEIVEDPLKAHLPKIFPNATADTWRNLVCDAVAVVIGWSLVAFLRTY